MAKKVVPGSITEPYLKRQGDFSPSLVGFQFTDSSSFLTFGNFALTTNLATPVGRIFNTGEFSESITLESLNLSEEESRDLNENSYYKIDTKLKYNKSNFLNYVYFSDAESFVEKEIEGIILSWPGSLYVEPNGFSNTVINFTYNQTKDTSTFTIPLILIENKFGLVTEDTDEITLDPNNIKILVDNFSNYEVFNEYGNFNLIGYTGNTTNTSSITIEVDGLVWPTLTTPNGNFTYHIKPKSSVTNRIFFKKLSDFQNEILDRTRSPKYTLKLVIPRKTELGFTFETTEELTWPTSDGYNIDVDTRDYGEYLEKLFNIAKKFDLTHTNIINRRLVTSAVLDFDTAGDGDETTGRKIDKLNKIWGREYDYIKKYIDGISFANVITYNGVDNTPDELVKMMAMNLGFDTIQSFSDNDLTKYLTEVNNSVFNQETTGLTIQELDTELWRRLVINAWWLFKSKGTRKVIEFFLKLFNINEDLVDFNEYVYVTEKKLNKQAIISKLNDLLGFGVIDYDERLPVDDEGFPKILPNTPEYYFQMGGFWYDGGNLNGDLPKLNGNNPHYGPYDFGKKYFDVFKCFIPNFDPTPQILTLNNLNFNYFTDYSLGTIEGAGSPTTIINNQLITESNSGNILNEYNGFYANLMNTTGRITQGNTIVGAGRVNTESNSGGSSFKITVRKGDPNQCEVFCPTELGFDSGSGLVTFTENNITQVLTNETCCKERGFYSYIDNEQPTPNIEGSVVGKRCYWCPRREYFQGQSVIQNDGSIISVMSYQTPEGLLKPVNSKTCCELRGFIWDGSQRLCRLPLITEPISSGDPVG